MSHDEILQKLTLKRVIILLAEIFFIAIIVNVFSDLSSYQPIAKIYVENIPSEIPNSFKNGIYEALAENIFMNTDNIVQFKNNTAKVREDTVLIQYNDELEHYDGSFVVDLDTLRQSYLVKIFWSKTNEISNDEPLSVLCPEKEDIIYEDSYCKNSVIMEIAEILPVTIQVQSTLAEKIARYYPEPYIDTSLISINLSKADEYSRNNKVLEYRVVACRDKEIISESQSVVKNWIISSGFNPDDHKLNLIDDCEDN